MPGLHHGINLAGHGQDERGFAAAVGAHDGHMLAGANAQIDIVQHHAVAAGHVYLLQFKKMGHIVHSRQFSVVSNQRSPVRRESFVPLGPCRAIAFQNTRRLLL